MKKMLLMLLAGTAFSATIMESLSGIRCADGEFRGIGVAESEREALNQARSMVATQIKASISVQQKSYTKQQIENKNETLKKSNVTKIEQEAELQNAQDAKIKHTIVQDGNAGIVVCLNRKDAAKPYLARQKQIADSLSMLAKSEQNSANPRQRKEFWLKGSEFNREHEKIQFILQSLGENSAEERLSAQISYGELRANYQNFCTNQKIYWKEITNDYASKMLFSKLSKDIPITTDSCRQGLQLQLFESGPFCEYKNSLGNYVCAFKPLLKGNSCSGETHFSLYLQQPLTGTSKTERSAATLLEAKIRNNDFSEWKKELKKWIASCMEL
ncbi:MAG: LPP20 family lipoprotein [Fibromonadaceae bacterium]|jgi:hypothetical protein|nr:LPP20 family lipoprotein [Fibromonadaceae bacterium]